MTDDGWEQVKVPKSLFNRVERLIKKKFKGDYGKGKGVPEFIREAVRLRLIDLGAYDEDLDEEPEDTSSNHD